MLMSESVRPRRSGFVGVTFGESVADGPEAEPPALRSLACLASAGVVLSSSANTVGGDVRFASLSATTVDVGLVAAVPVGERVMNVSALPVNPAAGERDSVLRFAMSREVRVRQGNLAVSHPRKFILSQGNRETLKVVGGQIIGAW